MNEPNKQSVLTQVSQSVLKTWAPGSWKNTRIVAAVSGGPDSVAMLRVLYQLVAQHSTLDHLVVAHVNHRTRAAESDRDQDFVQKLAETLGLAFELDFVDVAAEENPSELILRNTRYEILADIALRTGARYIATGHNLDDQVETILFRILRGTGIMGLTGIPLFRSLGNGVTIVRPFYNIPRETIKDLLDELDQDYQLDASNLDSRYARNFIRNELLPTIRQHLGEHIDDSLLRLGSQARQQVQFLDECCAAFSQAITREGDTIEIDCTRLAGNPELLVSHWLIMTWKKQGLPQQSMTQRHWQHLTDLVLGLHEQQVINLPGNIRAERTGTQVTIQSNTARS